MDEGDAKEQEEEIKKRIHVIQTPLLKDNKPKLQTIDVETTTLEELNEIISICEGTSDEGMTSESTVNEIEECNNSNRSLDEFDDTVAKIMQETKNEHEERVFVDDDKENTSRVIEELSSISLNTSPNSSRNETMGAEMKLSDAELHSIECIENLKLMIHNY